MSVYPVTKDYLADMRVAAEEFRAEAAGIRRYLRSAGTPGLAGDDLAREMDGARRRYAMARDMIWQKHFPEWQDNEGG